MRDGEMAEDGREAGDACAAELRHPDMFTVTAL